MRRTDTPPVDEVKGRPAALMDDASPAGGLSHPDGAVPVGLLLRSALQVGGAETTTTARALAVRHLADPRAVDGAAVPPAADPLSVDRKLAWCSTAARAGLAADDGMLGLLHAALRIASQAWMRSPIHRITGTAMEFPIAL